MGSQRYSTEFKQTAVEDLLAGTKRPSQICRERGIDFTTLRRWRQEYAAQGVAAWTEEGHRQTSSLEEKIADLERVVGQLTVENMVLKKALQQARSHSGCAMPSSKS